MYTLNLINQNIISEFKSLIIDAINDNRLDDKEVNEIHQIVFNEDYFIIGYYESNKWFYDNKISPFHAIEAIKNYEQDNFGEVITDFSSPEKVVNMFAYIIGEEIINSIQFFSENWDKNINEEIKQSIITELS